MNPPVLFAVRTMAFNLLPVGPSCLPCESRGCDRIKERYDYVCKSRSRYGHRVGRTGPMSTSAWAQTASTGAAAQSGGPASAAAAPAPAEAAAPAKRLTVTTGLDFTSAYLLEASRRSRAARLDSLTPIWDCAGPGRDRKRRHLEQRALHGIGLGNRYDRRITTPRSPSPRASSSRGCCTPPTRVPGGQLCHGQGAGRRVCRGR